MVITDTPKRKVPTWLGKVLEIDALLSEKLCLYTNRILPYRSLKTHYKALEISCHGIPWLGGWLAMIWILNASSLFQMQVNFYIGLLIDIILVAVIKAYVRRRRPKGNSPDMFVTIGPDKFSFPSGHASRAAYIVYFFTSLNPVSILLVPPLLFWSTGICLSRVLLRRHHLLDVIAGINLGILEGYIVRFLWLDQDWCQYLVSWML